MAEKTALDEAVERQYKGLSFDELNALYDDERDSMSMDYDEYFDDMDLTDIQKLERKDSAQELEEVFRDLLALIFYFYVDGVYDYAEAIMTAQEAYGDALYGVEVSEYFRNTHIPVTVSGIVNTMLAHPENPFNFSMDRVRLIAENESNSIWNDAEYEEAIKSGKTHKKWHSIIDKKTRDSHRYLDGKIKRIEEPFEVGDSLMMYPKDESFGAGMEEIANCRCSVEYFGDNKPLPSVIAIKDTLIHRSLGAKAKNYDVMDLETGEIYHFAENTRIQNSEVFAGKGTSSEYRRAYKYAEKYGGEIKDWQHCKGDAIIRTTDGDFKAEVHWSQCEGFGKHDFFIKRWLE